MHGSVFALRRGVVVALAVPVALGLAACGAVVQRPTGLGDPAPAPPARWAGPSPAVPAPGATVPDLSRWWEALGDDRLTALVAAAQRQAGTVEAARTSLAQARALRDVAAAGLQPTLAGNGAAQRNQAVGGGTSLFKAGFDAGWEPDVFGGQRATLAGREADAAASAARLADAQVSVAAEVALDYLALRGTQARLAIAEANLAAQQDTRQLTHWRAVAGLVSALDAVQADTAVAQLQAQLPALRTTIDQSAHALAVLTGQPPAAFDADLRAPRPLPALPATLALAIPAETLRQRPDVRAARAAADAAAARLTAADAARYPSLTLGGTLGLQALTLGGLGSTGGLAATLAAALQVPILDGGAARANVRAQQALLDQARAAWRTTVLGALKDVEDALVALDHDRQRVDALQAAATSAADAATLARVRHDSGLIDFLTLLDTQRSRLSAEDALATARTDLASDHVRLYKALGGGWTPDVGAAGPPARPADTAR